MLSGFQKFMLWVSFIGVIVIVIWVIIIRPCPCPSPVDLKPIETRLDTIEKWADAQSDWHEEVQEFLEYIESSHNFAQNSGRIDFWPPSGSAGEDPPSGPPCRLGGC